jgi:hypothetical protein
MRLFGIAEANHYCSSFATTVGDAEGSIEHFQQNRMGNRSRIIREGTSIFAEYRDCSLRDVERCLFFAASHYRRCLDLMIPSASPWAHVTIYYGSWYASRALLGMFGCAIFNSVVVDVHTSSPGQQVLRLRRFGNGPGQQPTTYTGSHRRFWDLFYRAVTRLRSIVQPHLAPALSPVGGDPVWLIKQRNDINYDSWASLDLVHRFRGSFSKPLFPRCLPGFLVTQFTILESLLELSYLYASQFNLRTDTLVSIGRPGYLRNKVAELVYNEKSPGLVRKTRKSMVT